MAWRYQASFPVATWSATVESVYKFRPADSFRSDTGACRRTSWIGVPTKRSPRRGEKDGGYHEPPPELTEGVPHNVGEATVSKPHSSFPEDASTASM